MANVNVTKSINVSAADAWSKLGSFEGIEHFSPIASSVIEGSGAGAKRICTMPDGAEIKEVLNSVDAENMKFEYAIISGPFPISDYVSNVSIAAVDAQNCEISWTCSFKAEGEAEAQMKEVFDGFYNEIIESLESLIRAK